MTGIRGLVLAGGESRRMGRDKGSLVYPALSPLPAAARIHELLLPFCDEVFVSLRPDQAGLPGLPRLDDKALGAGPGVALLTALEHANGPWLVIACDFPFAASSGIQQLIAHRDPERGATCYKSEDGKPEPLFAIWEITALLALRDDFALQRFSPRATLERLPCRLLTPLWPQQLINVNSMKEAQALHLI